MFETVFGREFFQARCHLDQDVPAEPSPVELIEACLGGPAKRRPVRGVGAGARPVGADRALSA